MAESDQLKALKEGARAWRKWREENDKIKPYLAVADLHGADLHEADLHEADLHEANLIRANLSEANLHVADLRGANLSGANLIRANLSEADLHGANLSGAGLSGAVLRKAKLSRANLHVADLRRANLRRANLSEANLHGAYLSWADLSWANLSGADLSGADLEEAILIQCNLTDTDFRKSSLIAAHLDKALLKNSDFSGANLRKSILSFAKLINAIFENAFLDDAIFFQIEIESSNFKNASIDRILDCSIDVKKYLSDTGAIIGDTVYAEEAAKLKSQLENTKLKLKAAEEESKRVISTSIPAIPLWQSRNFEIDKKNCFVIMPFTEEKNLKAVYEDHTKKIVESLKLKCIRADDIFKHQMIMEDIWEQICVARFLIADLTDKNPNVFYELGIAHTIGKRFVLITQNDDDVPFDLRHLRFIKYEVTPRGMEKFEDELKKAINSIMKAT